MAICLKAARRYAELGFAVLPLRPGEKRPASRHGLKDATRDPDEIDRWDPASNLGIRTDGLIVVDVDPGAPESFLEEHRADLDRAPAARTPRDGWHFFFRDPSGQARNTASRLAPNIDTRACGGYAAAWPSSVDGKEYRWVRPIVPIEDLPEAPPWLVRPPKRRSTQRKRRSEERREPRRELADEEEAVDATERPEVWGAGCRNERLTSMAGSLRRAGLTHQELLAALRAANATRCRPRLARREVETIAASVARYDRGGEEEADVDETQEDDPGALPDNLLSVPGFIDGLVDLTLRTAHYPNKVLAFAGALSLFSALTARRLRDRAGTSPTLFTVATAGSGVGKNQPRRVAEGLLGSIDGGCVMHGIASAEGLEDRLQEEPSALLLLDEFDALLASLSDRKDFRYQRLASFLMTLYTAAGATHRMRAKAGLPGNTIHAPALVLLGTAIPTFFYKAVTAKTATNGLFARLLVFDAGKRGKGQEPEPLLFSDEMLQTAGLWLDAEMFAARPVLVPVSEDRGVPQARRRWRRHFDALYSEAEAAHDEPAMALWARGLEKTARLVLLHAASGNPQDPVATPEGFDWAGRLVDHLTKRMVWRLRTTPENTQQQDIQDKVLRGIATARAGLTARQVTRRWRGLAKRDRDEALETLQNAGLIFQEVVQTGGRPRMVWKAR